jgi:hypothetical protein
MAEGLNESSSVVRAIRSDTILRVTGPSFYIRSSGEKENENEPGPA